MKKKQYTCSVCGKRGPWDKRWRHHLPEIPDSIACSPECVDKLYERWEKEMQEQSKY